MGWGRGEQEPRQPIALSLAIDDIDGERVRHNARIRLMGTQDLNDRGSAVRVADPPLVELPQGVHELRHAFAYFQRGRRR
jgi:hypothetical protein